MITKLQRIFGFGKSLSTKTVALHRANLRFVGCRAVLILEFKGMEVGFIDFAAAAGAGNDALMSFNFDKVLARLPTVVKGEVKGVFVVVGYPLYA